MTAGSGDPKPEDNTPPTHCHLPDCPRASQVSRQLRESHDNLRPLLQAPPTTAGRLSTALTRCQMGQAQITREHYSPGFLPCGVYTGLYKTAQGITEEEATEVDD